MATIDLKLKSYDELQFEIMRLTTDNYLKQQQIDQLTNNWNELEEWLAREYIKTCYEEYYRLALKDLYDKMEVMKMKDNKENIPLCYSLTSGETDYDNLYFFLINNMSFNYVFNLYRMIKEKLEELQNGSDSQ